ncbi:MAG: hypothetical protein RLZZ63_354 [Gemmatimonadota bacterium]|jgi:putative nucleotidyltransferase with HDIG domain
MAEQDVKRIVAMISAGAASASAAMYYLGPDPSPVQWQAVAFFTLFGLIASGLGYKTSKSTSGSIGFLPFLSVAVISPNYAALASVALSIIGAELAAKRPIIKATFNVAQFVFAEAIAIGAYIALKGTPLTEWPEKQFSLIAFALMVALWMMLNKFAVSSVVGTATSTSIGKHWIGSMRMSLVYDLFAFPLIFFFAAAYVRFGALMSSALALPMIGMRQLYKTNISLQKINEELLQLMVATVDAQDPYTSGHSIRVSEYSKFISRVNSLTARQADRVVRAALLHDVGKIYSEFAPVLRKPGRLTEEEYSIMKTHSKKGADLVGKVTHFEDLVPIVLSHHEAWDGSGYPNKISGEQIPLGARIIALADTIDAMSTSRPYREGLPPAIVMAEIRKQSGRQFDPSLCERLLASWSEMEQEMVRVTGLHPVTRESSTAQERPQLVA